MVEENFSLRALAEAAETKAFDAKVVKQTLEVDLATKQYEYDLKGQVLEELQRSNKSYPSATRS